MRVCRLAVLLILVLAFPPAAMADGDEPTFGTVSGTITSEAGSPISGAKVEVYWVADIDTAQEREYTMTVTTDADGHYETAAPAAQVRVLASASGFHDQSNGRPPGFASRWATDSSYYKTPNGSVVTVDLVMRRASKAAVWVSQGHAAWKNSGNSYGSAASGPQLLYRFSFETVPGSATQHITTRLLDAKGRQIVAYTDFETGVSGSSSGGQGSFYCGYLTDSWKQKSKFDVSKLTAQVFVKEDRSIASSFKIAVDPSDCYRLIVHESHTPKVLKKGKKAFIDDYFEDTRKERAGDEGKLKVTFNKSRTVYFSARYGGVYRNVTKYLKKGTNTVTYQFQPKDKRYPATPAKTFTWKRTG